MKRRRRLRRLAPDEELIRRRAAGEPLRELASDYGVAHTTLGRYFERPEVATHTRLAAKAKRRRRLRRLAPDEELIRCRAAGEPLRQLGSDYAVADTTLARYFERPEVATQLRQAAKQLRAEQRPAADRRSGERRLEREVRRKAKKQAAREREQARRARVAARERPSRRGRLRSDYEAWLDERDARLPPTRADLHSRSDEAAARVVAAGGGSQAVLEATGLRTLENAARLLD